MSGILDSRLMLSTNRYKDSGKGGTHNLLPLLNGVPVYLLIDDKGMRKKRRIPRPILCLQLVPTEVYGTHRRVLLCSLPGYGCELIDVKDIRVSLLCRAGLSVHAARVLAAELAKLFEK